MRINLNHIFNKPNPKKLNKTCRREKIICPSGNALLWLYRKKGGGLTSNDVAATLKGLTEIELQMGVHLFYWDFLDKNVWGLFNYVYSSAVTTITVLLPTFMNFNKTNVQVKLSLVHYVLIFHPSCTVWWVFTGI